MHTELVGAGFGDIGPHFNRVFGLLAARPMILRELAAIFDRTPTGMLLVVKEMEEKGYVERTLLSADRRMRPIRLTKRARAAMGVAERFRGAFEARLAESTATQRVVDTRSVLEALLARAAAAEN